MNTKLQEVILLFLKPDFLWKPGLQPQEFALNIAAILDMEKDFNSGFLFGLDNSGRLIGVVSAGGEWKKCISEQKLELLTWTHVAMTFSSTQGIRLIINGKTAGELNFTGNLNLCNDCKIFAGKTQTFAPAANTERATSKAVKTQNRFDGLMDELKVYDVALKPDQILANYKEIQVTNPQPLSYRKMPSGDGEKGNFGAYYTRLKYAPGWDALWQGVDFHEKLVFNHLPQAHCQGTPCLR